MIKVGITGNMGSGKSLVCAILESWGTPVFYADEEARKLMSTDVDLRADIIRLLGEEAYHGPELNRPWIAREVFGDALKLERLNALVHPRVQEAAGRWFARQASHHPYAVEEAALLIESGGYRLLDKLILVTAPEELRLQRVMHRDGTDREAALARMARQWPEEKKVPFAHFIIKNDEKALLLPQVWAIHQNLVA